MTVASVNPLELSTSGSMADGRLPSYMDLGLGFWPWAQLTPSLSLKGSHGKGLNISFPARL